SEDLSDLEILFSESNSRFVATVPAANQAAFEKLMADVVCTQVGTVTAEPTVTLKKGNQVVSTVTVDELTKSYKNTLTF
ncbi:MAG: hypothetical protein KAG98_06575, partial [Lentisphaeria bacterium]|nr:hypothetical protein [Lentisphaeria bacterium]